MELKFIGNGSGFSETNNNAFFIIDNDLYIIDCSMLNMNKIKRLFDFSKYSNIYIIVTHMHADHVSGIANLIDYLYYMYGKFVNIISPSTLIDDIKNYNEICGVLSNQYNIIDSKNINIIKETIKVNHSHSLKNGCFGYLLNINNKNIIYTGDTSDLIPFEEYLDICDELYVDVNYNNSKVHIGFHNFLENIPNVKKIYLMHIDEEDKIRKEIKDYNNIFIAEIFKG